MISKEFTPKKTICKVTLQIPAEWAEKEASVVGDFNEWDPQANKLEKKNGGWETVLRLKPETEYKFRYFLDGDRWENDDQADDYVANEYGTKDSVVVIGK